VNPPAPDVRYVVLSDLHLGDRDSLLTSVTQEGVVDPASASPALVALAGCLHDLVDANRGSGPVTLILNGDLLELAFGSGAAALNTFERLGEVLFRPDRSLFDRILVVPGNHDHHLWEMGRETDYRSMVGEGRYARGELPSPRHVTPLNPANAVPSVLLDTVLSHVDPVPGDAFPAPPVRLVYPNLALVDKDQDRVVVLHHGHYVEPLYHAFSRLRRILFPDRPFPETVHDIEAENFAWIDFVWSLFGRSGGAGDDAQQVFDMLLYPERTQAFARDLAARAAPALSMPFLPVVWLRRLVLEQVFLRFAARASTERTKFHVVCSEQTIQGIRSYLFGPAFRQIADEVGRVPHDVCFVMGHTHKPFERELTGGDPGRSVRVYNTGGWVIDALDPDPAFGASVLLLSDSLDVASLRVFNDGTSDGHYRVAVRTTPESEAHDPFVASIRATIAGREGRTTDPWLALADALRSEVALRRRLHRERRRHRA
jgi:UDP-2,3-diacylglucosamine pyrophosphatase LpxH